MSDNGLAMSPEKVVAKGSVVAMTGHRRTHRVAPVVFLRHASAFVVVLLLALVGALSSAAITAAYDYDDAGSNVFDAAEGASAVFEDRLGTSVADQPEALNGRSTLLRLASEFVAPRSASPSGSQYSVGFEMQLDPSDFGRRRQVHFQRANESLDNALRADPAFAAQNGAAAINPEPQAAVEVVGPWLPGFG